MRFYRNHYGAEGGGSGGYSWHTRRREAEATAAAERRALGEPLHEVAKPVEINPDKKGILAALQRYAIHPDNG